ncbi:hypothetical protein BWQ96_06068 [Gracilariopsis chorda]|uniref:Uncharacterized protein n=1 Tax=Gracilariopsis chorda TaxID=448386 RepID=A0A2V3IQ56_9FLOR|nr:hypothetical protein BWQ96_06068 [Gracilariopsis chorda]|eukprot:PXF44208.1 hypothetical protein BWQ96_06068 [Gracilariopsis chorda]
MNSAVHVSILLALFFAVFTAAPLPSRSAHHPHARISRIESIHAQHRAILMRAAQAAPAAVSQPPADIAAQHPPNGKHTESEDKNPGSKHEEDPRASANEETSPSVSSPTPAAQTDKSQADTTPATQAPASAPSAASSDLQSKGADTKGASGDANQSEAEKPPTAAESAVAPSADQRLKTPINPSVSTVAIIGAAITVLIGVYVVWSKSSRGATQATQSDDHTYHPVDTDPRADGAAAPNEADADGWNAGWEDDEDWEPTAAANKV